MVSINRASLGNNPFTSGGMNSHNNTNGFARQNSLKDSNLSLLKEPKTNNNDEITIDLSSITNIINKLFRKSDLTVSKEKSAQPARRRSLSFNA